MLCWLGNADAKVKLTRMALEVISPPAPSIEPGARVAPEPTTGTAYVWGLNREQPLAYPLHSRALPPAHWLARQARGGDAAGGMQGDGLTLSICRYWHAGLWCSRAMTQAYCAANAKCVRMEMPK